MNNLFMIDHSVKRYEDGLIPITLYRVKLNRKGKKTYSVHSYFEEGFIKLSKDKTINHEVKDLFTLRYLNLLYLREQTIVVTPQLVAELILQAESKTPIKD